MNDINRQPESDDNSDCDSPRLIPEGFFNITRRVDGSQESDGQEKPTESPQPRPQKKRGLREKASMFYLRWWGRLPRDRRIELILVLAIVFFAWRQYSITKSSSESSTGQLNQIIVAADRINDAADSFSGSASHINDGIDQAVSKLDVQASELGKGATQTGRVADETRKANQNVLETDRPWFGATLSVDNFEVGKIPVITVVFSNSGKRPAKITLAQTSSKFFTDFPEKPPFGSDTPPSTAIVAPGGTLVTKFNSFRANLSQDVLDAANAGNPSYFIYSDLEYTDVILNKQHWAHFCWQYIGNSLALAKAFYGCHQYNETDN